MDTYIQMSNISLLRWENNNEIWQYLGSTLLQHVIIYQKIFLSEVQWPCVYPHITTFSNTIGRKTVQVGNYAIVWCFQCYLQYLFSCMYMWSLISIQYNMTYVYDVMKNSAFQYTNHNSALYLINVWVKFAGSKNNIINNKTITKLYIECIAGNWT